MCYPRRQTAKGQRTQNRSLDNEGRLLLAGSAYSEHVRGKGLGKGAGWVDYRHCQTLMQPIEETLFFGSLKESWW